MIDKKFMMAFLASMILIVGYNFYYDWRYGEYIQKQAELALVKDSKEAGSQPAKGDKPSQPGKAEEPAVKSAGKSESVQDGGMAAPVAPESLPEPAALTSATPEADEKVIHIYTGVTKVALSNRGGVPVKYTLEKYKDKAGAGVDLRFDFEAHKKLLTADGKALPAAKAYPLLGLKFPKDSFSDKINNSLFSAPQVEGNVVLKEGDKPFSITYALDDPSGIRVRKTYTFHPNSYNFDVSVIVKTTPNWGVFDYSLVLFGLGDEVVDLKAAAYSYHGPILMNGKERIAKAPTADKTVLQYSGDIPWAAITNRYYAVFGIPKIATGRTVLARFIDEANYSLEWQFKSAINDAPEELNIFLGPKEHEILGKYTNGVFSVIDYGWFDVIAKPLFVVLEFFHGLTGNWGWAIILLTVVAKLLFFPLSQKSFRSMQRLQKLQPLVQKLQDVYKDDREKLNQEMLRLYRENKVNPLGGCLPMLLQIPIFFALYKVLLESIELKGAGWILWIKDLAQMDPYYVTPVLMGATMVIQQMMAPKTGDPLQRKMMMALPFVFTFMFLTFPAGLVVYWLVSNILTIAQQWVIYREAK